jgi:hypothetical protein
MVAFVERSKRAEAEVLEVKARLQAELLSTQDKVKWLEKTGAAMRVKLQVGRVLRMRRLIFLNDVPWD